MLDPDFLAFDDLLTWRRSLKDPAFNPNMTIIEFLNLYNSKKIKLKTKKLAFDGMLTQEELNSLINKSII